MIQQNRKIIGREAERELLMEYMSSGRSEFIALYGRRRVGKTYLIRELLGPTFTFYATGILNGSKAEQIANFNKEAALYGCGRLDAATDWDGAFENVSKLVEASPSNGKKVIFFDEVPWMSTPKSGFLPALEHFWNRRASMRDDVLLIICGSAASWMISNIVNDTGGLHNRLTGSIALQAFTLKECEGYLRMKGMDLPRYQIAECHMVFGGIPYYLDFLRPRLSLAQNVDEIYFKEGASLRNEYANLYRSLFRNPEGHMRVINALAAKGHGETREEVAALSGLSEGGGLSKVLEELTVSGFVRRYRAFGKKRKDYLYQLIDPFSLFHLRFNANRDAFAEDYWLRFCNTPAHSNWAGHAFEILCLLHVRQIRGALGISGVLTEIYSWRSRSSDPGAQIDLVIDRGDRVINLCEMKYVSSEYAVDKAADKALRDKKTAFVAETRTRKAAHTTMITTYGLRKGKYQAGIPFDLTLDALFGD